MPELDYTFLSMSLDRRKHRACVTPGYGSRLVGTDGRYVASLRRFPGMSWLRKLLSGTSSPISDIRFFRHLSIQKGNTPYFLRGFVTLAKDDVEAKYNVEFHYYDTQASAWAVYRIDTNIPATSLIDALPQGKFLYYGRDGQSAKVVWYDSDESAMTSALMGPGDFAQPTAPGVVETTTGGVLQDGEHAFCYRYRSMARNVYSGFSDPALLTLTGGAGTSYVTLSVTGIDGGATNIADFDTVEIYRTISVDVVGDTYQAGVFYLVGTTTLTEDEGDYEWTYAMGSNATDAMTDRILVQQPLVDLYLEEAAAPPKTHLLATYQGTTFAGGSGGTDPGDSRAKIQWSPLHRFNPENFPSQNVLRLDNVDGRVIAFVEAGDYLYALAENTVYRFEKVGPQLTFTTIHLARGPTSRFAAAPIDNAVMMVCGSQLILMHSGSGGIVSVGAVDRVLSDDWAGELGSVGIASDSLLGCVFVLNPESREALCVWQNNLVTQLEDMNFKLVTSGPHPSSGGVTRAWFITEHGIVVTPDGSRSETKRTMMGVTGTVNGTATAGNTTTLTDSTAAFDTTRGLEDGMLHILSGANAGLRRVIASNTGTQITVTEAFPSSLATGVRYAVAPVVFEIRPWPLGNTFPEGLYPRDMFRRWVSTGMQVHATDLSGEYTGANGSWEAGFYRNAASTSAASVLIPMDANPSDCAGAVNVDGVTLEPYVRQVGSNIDFELLAVKVMVKSTRSREVAD